MNHSKFGSLSLWLWIDIGSSIVVLGVKHYMPEVYWILDFIRSVSYSHFFLIVIFIMIPVSLTFILSILAERLAVRLCDIFVNGRRWGSL